MGICGKPLTFEVLATKRMMKKYQLIGEYDCKIDAKGRIKMPTNLLKQLVSAGGYEFVVNRGYENHINMFPQDVWEEKTNELNRLNINVKKHRQLLRYFHRGATVVSTDAAERILLPKFLVGYAGIEKEVVLFAYRDQIEIWAKEVYETMIDEEPENYSDLAEDVFGDSGTPEDE